MDRRNLILSGILVFQVAVAALLFWPGRDTTAAAGALIEDMESTGVTGITVEAAEATIELNKAGDGWVLANYGDYPANSQRVTELLEKLFDLDRARVAANTVASHTRLQVADNDYVRKVTLAANDGKAETLYIGSSPSLRTTNVRPAGSDLVYLTGDIRGADIRTDVGGWAELAYLQMPSEEIQAVTIENADGVLHFRRVDAATWTLDELTNDEQFSQSNFTTILTRLSGLNMVTPVGKTEQPEFGMDEPLATVTVATRPAAGDPQTLTLIIGAQDETGVNYFAKSSASDFYVKLASFTAEAFINDTRDRYIELPPTPEASSALTETLSATGDVTVTRPITSFAPFELGTEITATEEITGAD